MTDLSPLRGSGVGAGENPRLTPGANIFGLLRSQSNGNRRCRRAKSARTRLALRQNAPAIVPQRASSSRPNAVAILARGAGQDG